MAKIELHPDFKDFLKLLNAHDVMYLQVGGFKEAGERALDECKCC